MQTDEGLEGIGESAVYHLGGQGRAAVEERVRAYVGKDPLSMNSFAEPGLFACALLDIAGQAYGIPVHRFFGEKVRNRAPVSYWSCPMEPHETAAEAEAGPRLGFGTIN